MLTMRGRNGGWICRDSSFCHFKSPKNGCFLMEPWGLDDTPRRVVGLRSSSYKNQTRWPIPLLSLDPAPRRGFQAMTLSVISSVCLSSTSIINWHSADGVTVWLWTDLLLIARGGSCHLVPSGRYSFLYTNRYSHEGTALAYEYIAKGQTKADRQTDRQEIAQTE